jgi:DNA transformation protein
VDDELIRDLFSEFGAVQVKHMFGGAGLYAGGVIFALVSEGVIYLKADADTAPAFARENCAPFVYTTKAGKRAVMSYWRLPDRLYDEPEELAQWAQAALGVARSKSTGKPAAKARGSRKKLKLEVIRRPVRRG